MFFRVPLLPILAVYILAAILPAIILLRYVYRQDAVEKEPPGLLLILRQCFGGNRTDDPELFGRSGKPGVYDFTGVFSGSFG